ncbi:ABC transporter substrate-binding protein [Novosphingobium panipatense]|uniref:Peptide/nickel transport system substrate-binding protein/oligopeptide transport system substrate-binding protein n=2 Tax=Novosphingobium panipatense TaxID=428991 RepID=A0ABY1QH22_9SPHN|nr:ABC transporter substrate-binding protein [Novosphingobium panipatense]SMP69470.1 peptide/nickel transport system substrate-binding protein/oligopeptide transport system substrate-binding protein [Novosphingobium panipatense]
MVFKRPVYRVLAVMAGLMLASCSGSDNSAFGVAVLGDERGVLSGDDLSSTGGLLVHASTVEGLVAFDDAGRVIPALADRWIVTDDGQSYIFRLRDGTWANGEPITAESARRAFRAALQAVKGTPLAMDLAGLDDVRATAGRVIEIRLARPMPYLLQLLAQPELGLRHKGEGTGPMIAARAGDRTLLTAIDPVQLGMPAIDRWAERTRRIELRRLRGEDAVAAFNEGSVDLVLGGRIQDFLLTRSVGILRGTIQLDPVIGLFGLRVMNEQGFLSQAANREALAMTVDRDALIAPFGVGGWVPTTRIVSPSLDGDLGTIGERWSGQTIEERRAVAAARVRDWIASNGAEASRPRLTIWLPDGGGSSVLFERLSSNFAAIGVGLDRAEAQEGADLLLIDDVARYPRAAWFLNRLSCRARRGICSPEADARVADAAVAVSSAERAAMLTEAEAELAGANVFIPFGTPIRWSLVRGTVSGFSPNQWGWHPLMPLAWLPK